MGPVKFVPVCSTSWWMSALTHVGHGGTRDRPEREVQRGLCRRGSGPASDSIFRSNASVTFLWWRRTVAVVHVPVHVSIDKRVRRHILPVPIRWIECLRAIHRIVRWHAIRPNNGISSRNGDDRRRIIVDALTE
jgi:hypothetical protein